MHSDLPPRESGCRCPLAVIASTARARGAAARGRSASRNTAAPSPSAAVPVTFRAPPQPFEVGSETPSLTTPYTDHESTPCRRSGTSIVVSVIKTHTTSQLRNWKTALGTA